MSEAATLTPSRRLRLVCACGRGLRARARSAGKTLRCPSCAQPVAVPTSFDDEPPPTPIGTPVEETPPPPPLIDLRRTPAAPRDLRHEAHVRAIALWWFIVAAPFPLLFLSICRNLDGRNGASAFFVFVLGFVLCAGVTALFSGLGVGLWRRREWARIGTMLVTGLIGTSVLTAPWVVGVLWALYGEAGARLFSAEYSSETDERVAWWDSPFFYLPIIVALTCAGIVYAVNRR
jgi:hypothetical protein